MTCTTLDLPNVEPSAPRRIKAAGLSARVKAVGDDFFADPLPKADEVLSKKAYDALPAGGAFVAIEALIDDARRHNAFGLLMSLNMLIGAPMLGFCGRGEAYIYGMNEHVLVTAGTGCPASGLIVGR